MKIFFIKEEMRDKDDHEYFDYYIVLCYEPDVVIKIGDQYITDRFKWTGITKCSSFGEYNEVNFPRKDEGNLVVGGLDYNTSCHKVHTVIKTDKEGFAKFIVTHELGETLIWNPSNSNPKFNEITEEWDDENLNAQFIPLDEDDDLEGFGFDLKSDEWWKKSVKCEFHAGDFLDKWVHNKPNSIENRDWRITYNETKEK